MFVNKMNLPGTDRDWLLTVLQRELSENVVAFDGEDRDKRNDSLAMCVSL